jgi:hypothetical protein
MIQDLIRWDAARYQVHVTDIELVRDFVRLAQTVTRYGGDHESGAGDDGSPAAIAPWYCN